MAAKLPDRPLPNCYWVLPGELLAGEHPRRGTKIALEARERLRQLMDIGIDCFVDLTAPDELEPYELELPEGVQYLRRPIRDHGIPARREHMVEILGLLERALREGRRVYVHCNAGIGRTGMTIACWLVERGETGDSALDSLNGFWQQCARSRSWPYVPETEEQIEYVRDWRATSPRDPAAQLTAIPMATRGKKKAGRGNATPAAMPTPQALTPASAPGAGLRDRFQGVLLGLAVGDALAVATQGQKAGSFAPITDLAGGGPFELPPGAWTDETAMALCLAESLLERGGFEVRDQVERYSRWQSEGYLSATGQCVGITTHTARALGAAQWRRQVFAGSHDPKQLDPEVLARVAPPVLFAFGSPEEAIRLACDAARTTCQAPLALEACQLLAALIYGALADEPKDRILHPGPELLDLDALRPQIRTLLPKVAESAARAPHVGGAVLDTLAAAVWAFQTTDTFREGALRAANLGGHSDAIAAAYGQLAGAFYGGQAIPAAWRSALVQKALIAGFADRLFERAR